jgi:hypothetical protein
MKHPGTAYNGIGDPYAGVKTPKKSGIERMDMKTGKVKFLISLEKWPNSPFPRAIRAKATSMCSAKSGIPPPPGS